MPAWAWVIAAFLIPNLIGFIFILVFRGPSLGLAVPVASYSRGRSILLTLVDARRVPVSDDITRLTIAQSEVKRW